MLYGERCAHTEGLNKYLREQDRIERELERTTDCFREQTDFAINKIRELIDSYTSSTGLDRSYFIDTFMEDAHEML